MSDKLESIAYGRLMHHALRGLIHTVLSDVAARGLPGKHHFFITFDTTQKGVSIPDWLHDRYPDEMTIIIQDWYDDLSVDKDGFSITLNFGDNPERLHIPFNAILTFVDPSVEFGLRFDSMGANGATQEDPTPPLGPSDDPPPKKSTKIQQDAEVVRLDRFRKPN